jgi:hypothetical protein
MISYEYAIDEKSLVGSRFISEVNDELKRALATEKAERKVTQQSIADKLDIDRAVVNRRFMGLDNLTARTIAETLWAIGWEAHFVAKKMDGDGNEIRQYETKSSAQTTNIFIVTTNGPFVLHNGVVK